MMDINKLGTLFGIGYNSASMYGELEKIEQKQNFNYELVSNLGKKLIEYGEYAFPLEKGNSTEKLLGEEGEYYSACKELLIGDLGNFETEEKKKEYLKRRNNFFRVKLTIESIINKKETFKEDVENAKLFFGELSDKGLSEQEKISKNSSYISL